MKGKSRWTELTNHTSRPWRADKLSRLGSSIFAEVAAWKKEAEMAGRDLIDLSIGSPDLGPTDAVRRVLSEAVLDEKNYTYPGSAGSDAFREKCAAWMEHRFNVRLDPKAEVLSLMGSQDGLAHLAQAICNPGDLAIVPNPGYPIYAGSLAIAGVKPYEMPLREEHDFLPDLESIPDEIWEQAVFILLNFPGNPIAATADWPYFERLVALARKWNVLIVHDLAYSEMGFDGYRPPSILETPGAIETAVEFHSFSKSFNMAGCRIGFLAGNRHVLASLLELKNNIDYGVFGPIQTAAIAALEQAMDPSQSTAGVAALYERRRDALIDALAREGWAVPKPKATMFAWAKLPAAFLEGAEPWSSRQFARELLLETGVAVIPGDGFGSEGEGYVRIALVQEEVRLREAAARIGQFITMYGNTK
ncbi:aminotransferase class I/II-fold pyridoxal phosphate-dependent enzyme [Paenibacillus cellulositrophicus]|uniref:aminotransferase class I/II-fold pyridoxal phosphate-dependent enzyme n=1 Tax=Paenibacillus cellulositrophicus TaxID=562959 RepID=UPI00203D3651|nr:aminotransferase class I/II-fold pyridoxal phosphate-dependent enzyme [Paenibacillus cellulositrophicus]MCM2997988.1 aminotransferase class I/II-fold pyridoxal phosphate-dependent enzyme [Paenibacillus cellulositrophicus]